MLQTPKSVCTGCRACELICPQKCISMECDEYGFIYPNVNESKCVSCGLCNQVCHAASPRHSPIEISKIEEKQAYFGKYTSNEIVGLSSSGGAFSAIVDSYLNDGDFVFGSAYDENLYVCHTYTTKKDYEKLRKSKYVFSDLQRTYAEVERCLKDGKRAVFVGTPCQVAGLKSFLRRDYSELVTVDFICHGTPSARFLEEHRKYLENKFQKKVVNMDFRSKKMGWKKHCMFVTFDDGAEYLADRFEDFYFAKFMGYENLRECCYSCKYSNAGHQSDLTIADFWGITKCYPERDDDKGLSLIVSNTEKGVSLLNNEGFKKLMMLSELEWKDWKYIYKEHQYPFEKREQFLRDYKKYGWAKLADKNLIHYRCKSYASKIKRMITGTKR